MLMRFSVTSHPPLQRRSQTRCCFQHQRGNAPSLPRAGDGPTHTHRRSRAAADLLAGHRPWAPPAPGVTGSCSSPAARPGSSAPSCLGWPGASRGRDAGSGEPKQQQFCPKAAAEPRCAVPTRGTEHRNDRNNPSRGCALHLALVTQPGDQAHTGPFCRADASQEKAVIQPGLLPCSSPPCCSSPAAQPWFRIQASLFLDPLRKAPADASSDEDYSPAALQGHSQRVVYPVPRGCVARWQLYRGPVSPFDCTTRGDQSYTKSPLEKQK